MKDYTAAALDTLVNVWTEIRETENQDPGFNAELWRMAGHMCTAFAVQHAMLDDLPGADMFTWLVDIAAQRARDVADQANVQQEPRLKEPHPLELAIIQGGMSQQ